MRFLAVFSASSFSKIPTLLWTRFCLASDSALRKTPLTSAPRSRSRPFKYRANFIRGLAVSFYCGDLVDIHETGRRIFEASSGNRGTSVSFHPFDSLTFGLPSFAQNFPVNRNVESAPCVKKIFIENINERFSIESQSFTIGNENPCRHGGNAFTVRKFRLSARSRPERFSIANVESHFQIRITEILPRLFRFVVLARRLRARLEVCRF